MAIINSAGLTIRRYPELFDTIKTALQANVSSGLIFDEDTVLGQIISILSAEYAALEEVIQTIYDSMDRDKAEGSQLDSLVNLIGIGRILESNSSGFVQFVTREDVTIPSGTLVENPSSGDRFQVTSAVTATQSSNIRIDYKVTGLFSNHTYTVTVNGSDYSYLSDASATVLEVVTGLAAAVAAAGSSAYTASVYNDGTTDYLRIESLTTNNISTSVLSDLEAHRLRISVPVECTEVGPVQSPTNTITKLVSGVGGVYSLTNDVAMGVGRFTESDTELRVRAAQTLSVAGSSTYSALFTALSNIDGASNVVLIENNSGVVDSYGLPAKSFEAIVDIPSGDSYDQAVAATLWNEKPIGIETYGNVNSGNGVDYIDELGVTRTLKFSRPESVYIAIKVEYTVYDEEALTENLSDVIKQAVIDYGQTLTAGVDVIPRRFIGKVYNATDGLDEVTVYAQVLANEGDVPVELNWSQDKISIAPRETAAFNVASVFVSEV